MAQEARRRAEAEAEASRRPWRARGGGGEDFDVEEATRAAKRAAEEDATTTPAADGEAAAKRQRGGEGAATEMEAAAEESGARTQRAAPPPAREMPAPRALQPALGVSPLVKRARTVEPPDRDRVAIAVRKLLDTCCDGSTTLRGVLDSLSAQFGVDMRGQKSMVKAVLKEALVAGAGASS